MTTQRQASSFQAPKRELKVVLAIAGVAVVAVLSLCTIVASAVGIGQDDDGPLSDPVDVATTAVATRTPTATTTVASLAPTTTTSAPQTSAPPPVEEPPPAEPTEEDEPEDVYYANCTEARAAGAAPLRRGEPGYRSGLDRDDDGVACET
jgi:hypothetical protein